ncbi:MAG: DUF6677 family protein [Planctomycetota bacterium]
MPTAPPKVSASKGWLALLLTWVFPGAGHWLLGRRRKGIYFFVLITALYVAGMILADFLNVSPQRYWFHYLAEVLYGAATLVATIATHSLRVESFNPYADVGVLYTSVAGLLNVIVMVDIYEIVNPRPEPSPDA